MKEYKIVKQKMKFRNSNQDFEAELNTYAREGWHVVSATCISHSESLKVVLERNKNR